jgi:hypothetical protein
VNGKFPKAIDTQRGEKVKRGETEIVKGKAGKTAKMEMWYTQEEEERLSSIKSVRYYCRFHPAWCHLKHSPKYTVIVPSSHDSTRRLPLKRVTGCVL